MPKHMRIWQQKLSMHQNTFHHKVQGRRKHRIMKQFLPLLNQNGTHRKRVQKHEIICMLFWFGAWVAEATCQSLCNVEKNNKHLLIPALATVTHTTDHGKSNMATRVQIVLGSSTTCSEATYRGYPQGSALSTAGELQDSLTVSLLVQMHALTESLSHIFLAKLAMRTVLQNIT